MAQYSGFERKIARLLESQPWLRDLIRQSYKRMIYLLNKKKEKVSTSLNLQLIDIARKVGITGYDAFFFGYYDKSPWDKSGNQYLGHILKNGKCYVTLCDLGTNTHTIIKESTAWNYQQGAMSQWVEGTDIIFNTYEGKTVGAVIYNPATKAEKFSPYPVQVVNPKRSEYLSLNYRRLSWLRPDYGYFTESDNFQVKQDYDKDGIWKIDYTSGKSELIIKISDLILKTEEKFHKADHKVNHAYYSPDGNQFVFLHRWLDSTGKYSRLICASHDGASQKVLLDFRMISHYSWVSDTELVAWARTPEHGDAYIIVNSITGAYYKLDKGDLTKYGDGHPTSSQANGYIITDTYPDKSRTRTLILYNVKESKPIELYRLFSSWKFEAEKRCDLHPRWKADGKFISIDSAHEGLRKNYIIDVSAVTK